MSHLIINYVISIYYNILLMIALQHHEILHKLFCCLKTHHVPEIYFLGKVYLTPQLI